MDGINANRPLTPTLYPQDPSVSSEDKTPVDTSGLGAGIRTVGGTTKVIDVMTGEATEGAFGVYVSTGVWEIDTEGLTERQQADLEALLSIFGIDAEKAKTATIQTVLEAIRSNIKEQTQMLSGSPALSKADTATLNAMKASLEANIGKLSYNEKKILANVNRMLELKSQIESKVAQGYRYDGIFETDSSNFTLNTDVREMGDRIGDIRYYMNANGGVNSLSNLFNGVLPAMQDQVKGFLDRCRMTNGWGINVTITYSENTISTLQASLDVLKDPSMQLPPQINKDKLVEILEEILKAANAPEGKSVQEELEAKLAEIVAQIQDIELEMPVTA